MAILFSLVDAFADRPFAGNPAVVCPLPAWRDERWLQDVAAEMNQSETAYVVRNETGFDLRWFTPQVEVALCGHATLASAHALWQQGLANPAQEIQFSTKSGVLKAARRGDEIELDFPLSPAEAAEPPADLLRALGVTAKYVGRNKFDYLVEVESEAVVRQLSHDRHGPLVGSAFRLRQPLLRPRRRHQRGPRHRLGPLLPGRLLAKAAGKKRTPCVSGVGSRRHDSSARRRGASVSRRQSDHGSERRACVSRVFR
jgi:hypothetical protein